MNSKRRRFLLIWALMVISITVLLICGILSHDPIGNRLPHYVTMDKLIARPEHYTDRCVITKGFLIMPGGEGTPRLIRAMRAEDFKWSNAIAIALPADLSDLKEQDQLVIVEGVFYGTTLNNGDRTMSMKADRIAYLKQRPD